MSYYTNCTTATSNASQYIWISAGTGSTATTVINPGFVQTQAIASPQMAAVARELALASRYDLPDGAALEIDDLGNYKVLDKKAKVIYRANRVREFNPYISASDLLEAFIEDVGQYETVEQDEVLRLPIEAFINWLILKAAERDGDSTDGLPSVEQALPAPKPMLALPNPNPPKARCVTCGRFIRKAWAAAQIAFCSPEHMQLKLARIAA